jgi:hypothetical protein
MSAALTLPARAARPVVVRPAPRREPPFDDELPGAGPQYGRHDQRLPFERLPARPVLWQPRPPVPRKLPDPAPWGRRLLIGLIETAGGHRPLQQLASMVSPSVGRGLGADFERAARTGTRHWLHRATIRSLRVAEPAAGVAELCATVEAGQRVRAVAMRLEEHHDRWRCTRLQLG